MTMRQPKRTSIMIEPETSHRFGILTRRFRDIERTEAGPTPGRSVGTQNSFIEHLLDLYEDTMNNPADTEEQPPT